jgi:hypothetical protein
MNSQVRARFWLESTLAASSGLLAPLTVLRRDWIEAVTRLDPDRGSGSLEWAIVAALVLLCLAASAAARSERRRPLAAGS